MNLDVRGRQLDVGDSLRGHVTERLKAICEKYFSNPIEGNVVFAKERHNFRCDIQVHAGRNVQLQSSDDGGDPYVAFDQAAEKIDKRLRRCKRRLRDHHGKADTSAREAATAYVLEAEPEAQSEEEPARPIVIAEMESHIEQMTVSQAVMRMDLAELPALMFRNSANGVLNMVYRRSDGNIGWVDPKNTASA
ncbi:MAG: ribosome-associated translation inhibitor RaiA [Pseudomonadota bacterium]